MSNGDKLLGQLELLKRGLDEPGPAPPLDPERERAMLDAALGTRVVPPGGARGLRVAVAVALVAVGAAAGLGAWRLTRSESSGPKVSPPAAVPLVQTPSLPPRAEPAVGREAAQSAPAREAASQLPEAAPRAASRAQPSASADSAREGDLLKQANDLRRGGDFAGAEQLYRQVIQRYPQTASAYVAMSSVASLILNRDPSGAVEMYRAARRARPAGALDLENRQGLARGYRKLGQSAAERRELEGLVATYPNAEASQRAKTRLVELSTAPPPR
jgi:TolA-binding protein